MSPALIAALFWRLFCSFCCTFGAVSRCAGPAGAPSITPPARFRALFGNFLSTFSCYFWVAQGRLEQVTAICADREFGHVVIGDSAGHLRVWDLRGGIDVSTPDALRASFKQVGAVVLSCQNTVFSVLNLVYDLDFMTD